MTVGRALLVSSRSLKVRVYVLKPNGPKATSRIVNHIIQGVDKYLLTFCKTEGCVRVFFLSTVVSFRNVFTALVAVGGNAP